jgi:imidazole glycerol-phosphate synthase subunit HisH
MPNVETAPRIAFAATGVANLASIQAAFRRAGAEPYLASGPEDLASAAFAVVPGVGSFGSAVSALKAAGMDESIRDRITRKAPTMGVCAGMQIFFEASEESPGVAGLGLVPGVFGRFPSSLPVPQLGWNRVKAPNMNPDKGALTGLVKDGWAYFANSYRLTVAPTDFAASSAVYGEIFVAAAERPGLILCQFHPELSGPWGLELLKRWLASGSSGAAEGEASKGRTA